ncbi:hypothetical protein D3C76_977060 [compost metagenome]
MTLPPIFAGSIISALAPPPMAEMLPLLITSPPTLLATHGCVPSHTSMSTPPAKLPVLLMVALRIRSFSMLEPLSSMASSSLPPV